MHFRRWHNQNQVVGPRFARSFAYLFCWWNVLGMRNQRKPSSLQCNDAVGRMIDKGLWHVGDIGTGMPRIFQPLDSTWWTLY
jgi:hypothetical protein